MKLTRSSYYYKAKERSLWENKREADLQDRIEQIICEFPGYGNNKTASSRRLSCEPQESAENHARELTAVRCKTFIKRTTNS